MHRSSAMRRLALASNTAPGLLGEAAPSKDSRAGRGRGTAARQVWMKALIRLKLLFTMPR